jgi:hypothetical protein
MKDEDLRDEEKYILGSADTPVCRGAQTLLSA